MHKKLKLVLSKLLPFSIAFFFVTLLLSYMVSGSLQLYACILATSLISVIVYWGFIVWYDLGYKEGYNDGYKKGHNIGYKTGKIYESETKDCSKEESN